MRNYKSRKATLETLENRSLMAADIALNPATGALTILGTAGNDQIEIQVFNDTQATARVGSNAYLQFDPGAVRSIRIDAKAGSDSVYIGGYGMNALNPDRVDIALGTGNRENVTTGRFGSVGIMNIDAKASRTTSVYLKDTNVDQLFVDMGSDDAADSLNLELCDINRMQVNMGGGNDTLGLHATTVQRIRADMGSGSDRVVASNDAFIASGVVDGGSGTDTIDPTFKKLGKKFERTSR
jgi:hypothetical protein